MTELNQIRKAWTHSGRFHPDDVISGAMLQEINNGNVKFIRSRDPVTKTLTDVAFDVGYGKYDHHGLRHGIDPNNVPWCGATRLWDGGVKNYLFPRDDDEAAREVFYRKVLVPIALQDNGKRVPRNTPNPMAWVPMMNPGKKDRALQDASYENAVHIARQILPGLVNHAREVAATQKALSKLPKDKEILEIPSNLPGWEEYVRNNTDAKFAIYPGDKLTPWYAATVPKKKGPLFSKQVPFPHKWSEQSPVEIEKETGIPGVLFSHAGGFLSGYKTREAAIRACKLAIEKAENQKRF